MEMPMSRSNSCRVSHERPLVRGLFGLVALCCALLAACGSQGDPGGDSSTHFWRECNADEQCGSDYRCLCGHCSIACNRAADCTRVDAVCVSAEAELACPLAGNLCAVGEASGSDAGPQNSAPIPVSSSADEQTTSNESELDAATDVSDDVSVTSSEPTSSADAGPAEPSSMSDSGSVSPSEAGGPSTAAWTEVETVDDTAGSAFSPAVSVDVSGNAVVVWSSNLADSSYAIVSKYYSADSGWQDAGTLATSASLLTGICLAGNPDGVAVAAWVTLSDTGSQQLRAAMFTRDAGWTAPTALGPESPSTGSADCAVDAAGNAIVVFSHYDGNKAQLQAARFEPAAGWSQPERLDQTDLNVSALSLALDAAGNAMVLWNAWLGDQRELWSNRFLVEGGWQQAIALETTSDTNLVAVDVALASQGDGIGVWTEQTNDGAQSTAWAAPFTAEGNWGEPERVASGSDALSSLAIGITDTGTAVAVWEALTQGGDAQQNRILSRQRSAAGWSEPVLLADDAAHVSLALSRGGRAVAVWRTPLDYMVDGDIVGAIFDEGLGFGAATTFAESAGDSSGAWASINDSGRARIVWQHTTGAQGDIASSELP